MPSVINTNIASLNAQRNLTTSQSGLTTALQRLSSGLRINSAKDDAAGLAISERFSTQIRGLNQAVRNANDGISLAQTGEAALGEISNNLQRIRELSVQAANSTNSAADRAAINLEVQQRLSEIDRTAATTSFNGQKLFDGNFGNAAFQVGANAGESISVNLQTNMRNSETGGIATATAGTLGAASGFNGRVNTGAVTQTDFTGAGAGATAGRVSFTPTDFNYSGATGLIGGTSDGQAVTAGANFSTAYSAATAKTTTTNAVTPADWTTDAAAAHFEFTDDTVTGLTISLDDDFSGTGLAGIANAINTQLTAAGSNTVASVDGSTIVFTSGETGAAATQPSIANVGATLTAAGFAGFATAGGANETQSTAAELTIDGQVITLTGNHGSAADIATELQTKMQAAGLTDYTAAVSGGEIVITNPNAATAVDVSTVNASASAAGFSVNSGVAGSAAAASQSVSFQIDGNTINLTANYGNAAGVAAAIDGQLGGGYVVSESGGAITVARATAGAGSTAIDITGVTQAADQTSLGLAAATTNGTAGSAGTGSNNATFYVDGNAVNLTTDYSTVAGVATEIENQLQAIDPTYTAVEGDGTNGGAAGTIVISKTGMTAVNITGSDYNATQAGIAFASGQAGQASGAITLAGGGAFAINGTEISGTFTNAAALAAEINKSVQGVYADASSGNLVLSSGAEITLSGASATGATGFNTSTVEADAGNLSQIDVSTAAGALTALQRVDSALSSVSSLRSTFGAIQNRFESVINSLSTTAENLTSARSRIQDADFAAETANLTRGQILQQAGTAMLAQANSLPNGVLALLRG